MLKSLFKPIAALLTFLFLLSPASAEDFTIENYTFSSKLYRNNIAEVDETIEVFFKKPKHGIYRSIPFKQGSTIYDISVYQDGKRAKTKVTRNYNRVVIRIGSKNKLVNGKVTYQIHYKVFQPVELKPQSKTAWVGFNVLGTEWKTRTDQLIFKIVLPERPTSIKAVCGKRGESKKCKFLNLETKGNEISGYASSPIPPERGITLYAELPTEVFSPPSFVEFLKVAFEETPAPKICLALILAMSTIWFLFGRDKREISFARYYPPPIPPAEAGTVYDNTLHGRDIASIYFDWAAKGLIKIEEEDGDVWLTRLRVAPKAFKPYERRLFYSTFFKPSVSLKELSSRKSFGETLKDVKKEIVKTVDSYAYKSKTLVLSYYLRSLAGVAVFLAVIFGIHILTSPGISIKWVPLSFIAATVIFYIFFSRGIAKRSDKGTKLFSQVKGFKEFFSRVEKPVIDRILKEDPDYPVKYLAYAVALDIVDAWLDRFLPFIEKAETIAGNVSTMSHSMSSTISSQLAAGSVSSSSLSTTGGFSTGGGSIGGGGGGSW